MRSFPPAPWGSRCANQVHHPQSSARAARPGGFQHMGFVLDQNLRHLWSIAGGSGVQCGIAFYQIVFHVLKVEICRRLAGSPDGKALAGQDR
jgi:hypothetical protein